MTSTITSRTRGESTPTPHDRGLVAAICACVVLVVGMVAAVNLAVPMLGASSLHPSASSLIWIVDTYVTLFACLVIPGGAAGDRFGRKGTLITGLIVFAAGSLLSALAPNVAILLVGRAITGVGAAAVLPNTLAVLLHAVPAERRGPTIALWASMTGIGGVVGNVVGGAVLSGGSWRWLFVVAVPVGLALAAIVARTAPVSTRQAHRVDPLGAGLLTAASLALILGIVQGPQSGWGSATVIAGFVAAAALFVAWTVAELRQEHPLFDPRLFKLPMLRNSCLGMTAIFFGMFGLFYVNASLLQYGRGFSVLQTGLGIVPITVPIILGTRYVGRLVARIGHNATIALAFAFVGAGLLGLSTVGNRHSYLDYAAWLVLTGIGVALSLPTLSGAIAGSLPPANAGVAAGLQATTREFGSALGVAVIGTVMTSRFVRALPAQLRGRHTVAQALQAATPAQTRPVLDAFVDGANLGLRVIGLVVLALGVLICLVTALSRPRTSNDT